MDKIEQIFEQLDDWRNLPTYQLERRADIFFSLYLPKILKARTKRDINEVVIPEFPLHINTLHSKKKVLHPKSKKEINLSYRADYLALSKDGKYAYLVELKTDNRSVRGKQDKYLEDARDVGLSAVLDGVLKILEATKSKRKYFCLLQKCESLGLVTGLNTLREIMGEKTLHGFSSALEDVQLEQSMPELSIVCIKPDRVDNTTSYDEIISFEDVREIVIRHRDPLSKRFAESLRTWGETRAGDCIR